MSTQGTMKVRLYNSVTQDQHVVLADVPIDGKPHKVLALCKENNSAYPGKVLGNTVLIRDFQGAKFTLTSPSGKHVLVHNPQQTELEQRFAGEEQPLGDYNSQDYDLSNYTITASKTA